MATITGCFCLMAQLLVGMDIARGGPLDRIAASSPFHIAASRAFVEVPFPPYLLFGIHLFIA